NLPTVSTQKLTTSVILSSTSKYATTHEAARHLFCLADPASSSIFSYIRAATSVDEVRSKDDHLSINHAFAVYSSPNMRASRSNSCACPIVINPSMDTADERASQIRSSFQG